MTDGFVSDFGHLVIGNYLEFGLWDFNARLAPAILAYINDEKQTIK